MKIQYRKNRILAGIISLITIVFALIEFKKIYWGGLDKQIYFSLSSIAVFLCMLVIEGSTILLVLMTLYKKPGEQNISKTKSFFRYVVFILLGIFPSIILQFSPWGFILQSTFLRILLILCTSLLMTYMLNGQRMFQQRNIYQFFPSLIFLTSSLLLSNRIKLIVDYPFSLSWSEGNRFWDYSLLFWKDHYSIAEGGKIAAFLDLGRQSLWGLIFLCKNVSITGMRAWNTLLYFIPPLMLGLIVFKTKEIKPLNLLLFGLWTYTFLSEGPIYAPLIICAILVLLAEKIDAFPISLALIILSGYYANITRFTWIIAPPVWAFLLFYFREKNTDEKKRIWKSLGAAAAGLVGGLILPNFIQLDSSSIIIEETSSSDIFSSVLNILNNQDLLWNRLLPTETFPLGILPALILITIPVFIILFQYIRQEKIKLTTFEKLISYLALIGFLLIGIFVSVKIGGGSNLHNMDMFLLTLMIIIYIFWKEGAATWFMKEIKQGRLTTYVVLLLLIYQCFNHLHSVKPLSIPDETIVNETLATIQARVDEKKETGKILFIDQRQLLTFGQIKNIDLQNEYEKKFLMNEAMSNNADYFNSFYTDLKNQKYALIINEPINITYQEDDYNFGEENDAYVKWVSEPLLCYYEPLETFSEVGVELLVPRTSAIPDFLNCP
ncbi:MAG TPA: hypothetical protein DCK95_01235 [Anaerolineaceae bacterium]|nr:hypothetical protein [Anaerolineaceae bacterium]